MRYAFFIFLLTVSLTSFAIPQKNSEVPPKPKIEDPNGCANIPIANGLVVKKIEFGILPVNGQDSQFKAFRDVRLINGLFYGWRMVFNRQNINIKWREVFVVPRAPKDWGHDEYTTLNPSRTIGVTEYTSRAVNGIVSNYWVVVPGDPAGDHSMKIFVNDVFVCQLDFVVS